MSIYVWREIFEKKKFLDFADKLTSIVGYIDIIILQLYLKKKSIEL